MAAVFYQDDRSFPSEAVSSTTDIVKQIKNETSDTGGDKKNKHTVPYSLKLIS